MTGKWWKYPLSFAVGGVLAGVLVSWVSGYWIS